MSKQATDCHACGGEGWLPSKPEGQSTCPYCDGTGKEPVPNTTNPDEVKPY